MATVDDATAKLRIAQNLRRLRGERSYSEIARAVGTYAANIQRIELGLHMPGAGLLSRIAETLGVTTDALLSEPSQTILDKTA